jgi:hypothetical protein
MPPYYIGRFTPAPAGCEGAVYKTYGRSAEANGLRSCDKAEGAAKVEPASGVFSRNRVYGYALKDDGEAIKNYLKPFFDKGEKPDSRMVYGLKAGYCSTSRPKAAAWGSSNILSSINRSGKLSFAFLFGPGAHDLPQFQKSATHFRLEDHTGTATFSKKELVIKMRCPNGEKCTAQVRKYGEDLLARITIPTEYEGTFVDYCDLYLHLGVFGEEQ